MEFSRFRDILSPVLLATASRYVNLSKNITVYPIVAAKWSSRGVKTKLARYGARLVDVHLRSMVVFAIC